MKLVRNLCIISKPRQLSSAQTNTRGVPEIQGNYLNTRKLNTAEKLLWFIGDLNFHALLKQLSKNQNLLSTFRLTFWQYVNWLKLNRKELPKHFLFFFFFSETVILFCYIFFYSVLLLNLTVFSPTRPTETSLYPISSAANSAKSLILGSFPSTST